MLYPLSNLLHANERTASFVTSGITDPMTKRPIPENRNRHAVFSFPSFRELKGILMENLEAAQGWICLHILNYRLRWSRGSVLAFSTQVRGFKPNRSRRIFRAKKSSASFPSEGK